MVGRLVSIYIIIYIRRTVKGFGVFIFILKWSAELTGGVFLLPQYRCGRQFLFLLPQSRFARQLPQGGSLFASLSEGGGTPKA